MQQLQVSQNVIFDLFGLRFGIKFLQLSDDSGDGVFAVAAGDDFEAGAAQAKRPFWHEQHFLALIFAEANAGRELRVRIRVDAHSSIFSGAG